MISWLKNLLGRPPMNPWLFYTGKFSGYLVWLVPVLDLGGIEIVQLQGTSTPKTIGIILYVLGLVLAIISITNLGSSTRFGLPTNSTTLRQSGLYRFSRNPMYLGFNLMTLGSMIYSSNLIVIILGTYCIIVYHNIILGEEAFLQRRFGKEYLAFQSRVRRYIGTSK